MATALGDAFDGTALFVVIAMYRAFYVLDRDQVEELSRMDLTPIQFNILTTLQRVGRPTTIGALGSMLIVRPNHMSGNINVLVRKSYIERRINPEDSRSFLIELTKAGRAFLRKALPPHWRRLERLMGDLDAQQRMQLVHLLKIMVLSLQHARQKLKDDGRDAQVD